jgi:hypothetical protein
MSTHPLNET